MITRAERSNGWFYVSGVDNSGREYPLGPQSKELQTDRGTHYWGMERLGERRATLRLYFDPAEAHGDQGYIQFAEMRAFGGKIPLPPELFPGLVSRRRYVNAPAEDEKSNESSTDAPRQVFLDFLGPQLASALRVTTLEMPFYAFTGSLSRHDHASWKDWRYDSFGEHPLPHGSIRLANTQGRTNPTAAASLTHTVSPFFPTERVLGTVFQPTNADKVAVPTRDPQNGSDRTDFQIALAAYRGRGWPENQIEDVQVVGRYILMTRVVREQSDARKALGSFVAVFRVTRKPDVGSQGSSNTVEMWLVDDETFANLEHETTLGVLKGIKDWLDDRKIRPANQSSTSSTSARKPRGWGGDEGPPDMVWWQPNTPLLRLTLYSVLVEATRATAFATRKQSQQESLDRTSLNFLSGVETTLEWTFEPVTERLWLEGISPAKIIREGTNSFEAAVRAYKRAITNPPAELDPDMSLFDVGGAPWYDSAPPPPQNQ